MVRKPKRTKKPREIHDPRGWSKASMNLAGCPKSQIRNRVEAAPVGTPAAAQILAASSNLNNAATRPTRNASAPIPAVNRYAAIFQRQVSALEQALDYSLVDTLASFPAESQVRPGGRYQMLGLVPSSEFS
jgi:hypothetical protein